MTVLILTNNDIGLYAFRHELIEQLCKCYKVCIALPKGKMIPELEKLGCKYIPFEFNRRGMNPFADIKQVFRYIRLLQKKKPNVVLTYTIKPTVYGGIACQITKVPYIVNITGLGMTVENGGLLKWLSLCLYKSGVKRAKCVFFQNRYNQTFLLQKKIVLNKNRLIPGSGVNLQTYMLKKYPENKEVTNFLFVGRIVRDKGIEELLAAMRQLHKEYQNIFLDIVGQLDENYTDILRQAEAEGFCKYHGLQINMVPFYQNAHCVVLPSYHEGMSNALLEAAATGRPVIASRVPGCVETFDEGITGFGCEAKDANSLAEAMKKFLALSQKEREQMGIAGREKMEREFDRTIVIRAYEEEIQLAVQEHPCNGR